MIKRLSAPKYIPMYYNRAPEDVRRRLDLTCDHFGVKKDRQLVSESLLRLGRVIEDNDVHFIPNDNQSQALMSMYEYFLDLR